MGLSPAVAGRPGVPTPGAPAMQGTTQQTQGAHATQQAQGTPQQRMGMMAGIAGLQTAMAPNNGNVNASMVGNALMGGTQPQPQMAMGAVRPPATSPLFPGYFIYLHFIHFLFNLFVFYFIYSIIFYFVSFYFIRLFLFLVDNELLMVYNVGWELNLQHCLALLLNLLLPQHRKFMI